MSSFTELSAYYLSAFQYESALFYAERAYYESGGENNLRLIGECYMRRNQFSQASLVLQGCKEPLSKFMLATSYVNLGKYVEAEICLLPPKFSGVENEISPDFIRLVPGGVLGIHLMGVICKNLDRKSNAIMYFKKAVELESTNWAAIVELCDLGVPVNRLEVSSTQIELKEEINVKNVLSPKQAVNALPSGIDATPRTALSLGMSSLSLRAPWSTPLEGIHRSIDQACDISEFINNASSSKDMAQVDQSPQKRRLQFFDTPGLTPIPGSGPAVDLSARKSQLSGIEKDLLADESGFPAGKFPSEKRRQVSFGPNARLSFGEGEISKIDIEAEQPSKFLRGDPSGNLSHRLIGPVEKKILNEKVDTLYDVLVTAYSYLRSYECTQCIAVLSGLPYCHIKSGLVQYMIGSAYYELGDYKRAIVAFKEMMSCECYRLRGIEIFSAALWHLQREKELFSLAQQAVKIDRLSPEVWCIVGNCFSLQREPETAIKFFERAIQVNPNFTYAYTLCGHEYVANDDMEKAVTCFTSALHCDERHYNAWYGLGTIFYRQERLDLAEYHFRKALEINKSSSILKCFMGMVLHAQNALYLDGANAEMFDIRKEIEAYEILSSASLADPSNPQLHFQLVHVLLAMDNYNCNASDTELPDRWSSDEEYAFLVKEFLAKHPYLQLALQELHILESLVPREPPVFSLLGQIYYQKLKNKKLAVKYFTLAINLDAKETGTLKDILSNLEEPPGCE